MPTGRRILFRDRFSLNNVYVIGSLAVSFAQEVLRRACSRMTSTGVYHDRSGATEHARPLQRIAPDGNSYTQDEFAEWYGRNYRDVWDSASPSCQDEQTAGAAEHNASAAQSADQVLQSTDAYLLQTGPQAGATEHSAPATQLLVLPIILEVSQLQAIRDAESRNTPKRSLHGLAREALNAFADAHYVGSTCLDTLFPWKAYLASHPKGEMVVGPGITRAVVDQLQDVKDPNRGGRPRIDFIFYRVDGSAYRVHPGTKPKNDAAPVYCPPSCATEQAKKTCVWHERTIKKFTYEDACRIPQTDKLGKQQAFRELQNEPEQFRWWLFAANLGASTKELIGSGLISCSRVELSDTNARLRFQRHDGSTIDVEIRTCGDRGLETHVHW
jgi:hypothetical protein